MKLDLRMLLIFFTILELASLSRSNHSGLAFNGGVHGENDPQRQQIN